jgi:hypothetical protein
MNNYGGNPRMNELAQWMKLYDEQGIGGNVRGARGPDGRNPFDVNGMKADWAAQMMGGGGGMGGQPPPDFFGGREQMPQQPAYVQPQRRDIGPPPQPGQRDPRVMNYLAEMMGSRKPNYFASQG